MIFYYITILLIPFGNHPLLSHNVGGITPIKVFGGLALLYAFLEIAGGEKKGFPFWTPVSKYFMALIGVFAISALLNNVSLNSEALLRFVSIIIFYITTVALINSRERFIRAILLTVVCMDIAALYMFREFSLYGSTYDNFRPGGILGDPNYTALNLLTMIPIAYFLFKDAAEKKIKLFAVGSLVLYLGALGLSQSRGGLLGFAIEFLLILMAIKFRAKTIMVLGFLAIVIVSVLPIDIMHRFNLDESGVKVSTHSRYELLITGINMFKSNPLFGVGPGKFKQISDIFNENLSKKQIAHNSYLELAAELGIMGITIFLLIVKRTLSDLKRLREEVLDDSQFEAIITGLRIGIAGYLTAAIFLSAEYEKIIWLLIFATTAASKLEVVPINRKAI
jgi:O-antigen ligase